VTFGFTLFISLFIWLLHYVTTTFVRLLILTFILPVVLPLRFYCSVVTLHVEFHLFTYVPPLISLLLFVYACVLPAFYGLLFWVLCRCSAVCTSFTLVVLTCHRSAPPPTVTLRCYHMRLFVTTCRLFTFRSGYVSFVTVCTVFACCVALFCRVTVRSFTAHFLVLPLPPTTFIVYGLRAVRPFVCCYRFRRYVRFRCNYVRNFIRSICCCCYSDVTLRSPFILISGGLFRSCSLLRCSFISGVPLRYDCCTFVCCSRLLLLLFCSLRLFVHVSFTFVLPPPLRLRYAFTFVPFVCSLFTFVCLFVRLFVRLLAIYVYVYVVLPFVAVVRCRFCTVRCGYLRLPPFSRSRLRCSLYYRCCFVPCVYVRSVTLFVVVTLLLLPFRSGRPFVCSTLLLIHLPLPLPFVHYVVVVFGGVRSCCYGVALYLFRSLLIFVPTICTVHLLLLFYVVTTIVR